LFFETFKKDFIESTCVWLLILIFAAPLAWMLVYAFQKPNDWLMVIGIVIGYQLLMFTLYVFPVIAVFKSKSIISTIKNVLILQNSNLLTNLKLIGSLVIFVAGMMWLHGSFIFLLIPCYGFLVSFHLKSAFAPYIAQFKITIEEKENDNELLNI